MSNKRILKSILVYILLAIYVGSLSIAFVGNTEFVKTYYLNVRDSGSVKGKKVGMLQKGDEVKILEELENGWKKIQFGNGNIGYVNGRYLKEGFVKSPFEINGTFSKVIVNNGFVRARPYGKINAIVHKGDELEILNTKYIYGVWAKVKILSGEYKGREGYIGKKLISVSVVESSFVNDRFNNVTKSNKQPLEDIPQIDNLGGGNGIPNLDDLNEESLPKLPTDEIINSVEQKEESMPELPIDETIDSDEPKEEVPSIDDLNNLGIPLDDLNINEPSEEPKDEKTPIEEETPIKENIPTKEVTPTKDEAPVKEDVPTQEEEEINLDELFNF